MNTLRTLLPLAVFVLAIPALASEAPVTPQADPAMPTADPTTATKTTWSFPSLATLKNMLPSLPSIFGGGSKDTAAATTEATVPVDPNAAPADPNAVPADPNTVPVVNDPNATTAPGSDPTVQPATSDAAGNAGDAKPDAQPTDNSVPPKTPTIATTDVADDKTPKITEVTITESNSGDASTVTTTTVTVAEDDKTKSTTTTTTTTGDASTSNTDVPTIIIPSTPITTSQQEQVGQEDTKTEEQPAGTIKAPADQTKEQKDVNQQVQDNTKQTIVTSEKDKNTGGVELTDNNNNASDADNKSTVTPLTEGQKNADGEVEDNEDGLGTMGKALCAVAIGVGALGAIGAAAFLLRTKKGESASAA